MTAGELVKLLENVPEYADVIIIDESGTECEITEAYRRDGKYELQAREVARG